ncbi:MAG: hypothetical protein AAGF15_00120 [Pseudomonadota bacterium]
MNENKGCISKMRIRTILPRFAGYGLLLVAAGLAFAMNVTSANAQEIDPATLARCAAIVDQRDRLQCYDQAIDGLTQETREQAEERRREEQREAEARARREQEEKARREREAREAAERARLQAEERRRQAEIDREKAKIDNFGKEAVDTEKERARKEKAKTTAKRISARVTDIRFNRAGQFMVALDNEQVWKQKGADRFLRKRNYDGAVSIKKRFPSGYLMTFEDIGHTFAATRVR